MSEHNDTTKRATFELAPETRVIAGRLGRLQPGETVSYDELTQLIGRDVTGSARHILESARKRAEREQGIALGCVRSEGIKRLEDEHITDIGDDAIVRMRRQSKRASRRMLNAAQQVGPELSVKVHARASVLGAIALCANDKRTKQIEQQITSGGNGQTLPAGKVLDLFKT